MLKVIEIMNSNEKLKIIKIKRVINVLDKYYLSYL